MRSNLNTDFWLCLLFFFLFMSFIFDKLAPFLLTERFKIWLESFFESILVQKTVSEMLKRGIFLLLHFVRQANGRATAPLTTLLNTSL